MFGSSDHGQNPSDLLATQRQLAHIFRRSPSAVSRWPLEPARRVGRETYYSMRAAVDHVFGESGQLDLGRERARLASGQADRVQQDNMVRARALVPVEIVMRAVEAEIGRSRSMLLALAHQLGGELAVAAGVGQDRAPALAAVVDRKVRDALEALAAPVVAAVLDIPNPEAGDDA